MPLGPRDAVAQIAARLQDVLGDRLVALYLFGSLPAGAFVESRSDIDLLAVLSGAIGEPDLPPLLALHARFVEEHPEWRERVEVGYVPRALLGAPAGQIAAISPGEPLHLRAPEYGWVLNWHAAYSDGEVVCGPPPLELGPEVDFRAAVEIQLREWEQHMHAEWSAYVPAARGYAVVTHCRALQSLATGRRGSKEEAVEWVAAHYPERAEYVRAQLRAHRADLRAAQREAIAFAAWVRDEALGPGV